MQENTQGGFTGLDLVTLEQVANADRIRNSQIASEKARTLRRHGHKGSRQWGFMTPGGKRPKQR